MQAMPELSIVIAFYNIRYRAAYQPIPIAGLNCSLWPMRRDYFHCFFFISEPEESEYPAFCVLMEYYSPAL